MANGGPNRHGEGSWSATQFTGVIQPDTRNHSFTVNPHIVQASELRLRGQITEQNTCPTLLANTKSGDNDPLAVQAISFQPGNLARRAGSDPSSEVFPTLSKDSGDQNPHVATPMAVRRLTPVECERLQGFPDNWSRISWKGKPETECPDGPRYKACGNSMAVPVMRWIGERIAAYELSQNHETK
jgi:site-specific DNA-cytosine methylase